VPGLFAPDWMGSGDRDVEIRILVMMRCGSYRCLVTRTGARRRDSSRARRVRSSTCWRGAPRRRPGEGSNSALLLPTLTSYLLPLMTAVSRRVRIGDIRGNEPFYLLPPAQMHRALDPIALYSADVLAMSRVCRSFSTALLSEEHMNLRLISNFETRLKRLRFVSPSDEAVSAIRGELAKLCHRRERGDRRGDDSGRGDEIDEDVRRGRGEASGRQEDRSLSRVLAHLDRRASGK
jgi:hypothetical protein